MRGLFLLLLIAALGGTYWWLNTPDTPASKAPSGAEQISAYLEQFNPETLSLDRLATDPKHDKKIILQGLTIDQIWNDVDWSAAYQTLNQRPRGIDTLSIQGARLSLYHPAIGLLNFNMNAQIRFEGDDKFLLSGKITSSQKQLSLDLGISGQGTWIDGAAPTGDFDLQFEQTNFNLINLQLNRLSGVAKLAITNDSVQFAPTLQAGGMNIFGLPWQNVKISGAEMHLTAKSLGPDETAAPLQLSLAPLTGDITIGAKTLGGFLEYLERYGAQLQNHQRARTYSALNDIEAHIQPPQNGLWKALLQPAPLPQIDILVQKDGLKTHIAETILLPH